MNKSIRIYEFHLGDVEDPDFYSKIHIGEWVNTSSRGTLVRSMKGGFTYSLEHDDLGWLCTVWATIPQERDQTLYHLTHPEMESFRRG